MKAIWVTIPNETHRKLREFKRKTKIPIRDVVAAAIDKFLDLPVEEIKKAIIETKMKEVSEE